MTPAPASAAAATGVWTLAGGIPIIADPAGPATLLVPSEAVLLLAVALPLPSHAKRLAALPFAIEDRIADPLDAVHLVLGGKLADGRYLVAVVRHAAMVEWIATCDAAGLAGAAFVPDCLALPAPPAGEWTVAVAEGRALVRAGEGTGFAVPAALLLPAWEAAGKPRVVSLGDPLPDVIAAHDSELPPAALAERVALAGLDLRSGPYARRVERLPTFSRKLATILGIAAAAHVAIAAADTLMLHAIAERREADTRALVAQAAPGVALPEDDFAAAVADRLPRASGSNGFATVLARVSGALAPMAAELSMQRIDWRSGALVLDLAAPDAGFGERVRAALAAGGLPAQVAPVAGGVRVTVSGA